MANSDNPTTGARFEKAVAAFLRAEGIPVDADYSVPIGIDGELQKAHNFGFGCAEPPTIVECKAHTWTAGANAPSAKMSVWNEAMYYFHLAPEHYRKVLFVLKSLNSRTDESLLLYYVRTYSHSIPRDVEIWEFDLEVGRGQCLHACRKRG